ncbi:MAG: glycosyltransferase family 4 protein [Luteitalea sp.]
MKLACVVQRYGDEVTGGAEAHCRAIAERLAETHDVTVLTSCARDYLTWRNAYPAGQSQIGPVSVKRFTVDRPRHLHRFADLSHEVFARRSSLDRQRAWFEENGPVVPALLDHLRTDGASYDLVLFWSYRYYPSFFGLPLVRDRAVLVPTAEEDPLIWLDVLGDFFTVPAAYVFLTEEERALVASRARAPLPPSCVIGSGLPPAALPHPELRGQLENLGVTFPYALYLGRVEKNKGCETLFRHYQQYVERGRPPLPLVLAGPEFMEVPSHPQIRPLGFVPEHLRETLLGSARTLIMPSPYESLSLVLLEAWNHGVPALVNGGCKVLKGQTLRANGGLYYHHANEFVEALTLLATDEPLSVRLGAQGRAYVETWYRWPRVMATLEPFLRSVVDA